MSATNTAAEVCTVLTLSTHYRISRASVRLAHRPMSAYFLLSLIPLSKNTDDYLTNLDALNELVYLECVIYETLRVVQQSITLRKVLQDSRLDTERGSIALPPSWYVATILSVTNMDRRHLGSVENLEEFVPERFMAPDGSVDLQLPSDLPPNASVLTSTFGHGAHACPGRRFALAVTKLVLARILVTFDLTPQFQRAEIPASSVGALARVVGDCRVTFERHAS